MHVVVIGGGAGGFFGAIACAQAHPQVQVTLLEASAQVLAKVRISGGGRCNVTHACFDPALLVQHYPRGGKALRGPLSRFQPQDTVAWFRDYGVRLKTESDGRMFPVTDDSATIVNCLMRCAQQAGVEVVTGVPVVALTQVKERWAIQLKSGQQKLCDRILLATGSHPLGYRLAATVGHDIIPPVPSLFTFKITDSRLVDLAGVSVADVRIKLSVPGFSTLEQGGPLLITHWGMSGPAVLKLSAWGARMLHQTHYRATVAINWLPSFSGDELRESLLQAKGEFPARAIANHCPVLLPKRLWQKLVSAIGIGPEVRWADVSNKKLIHLLQELQNGQFEVNGKGIFKEEFVTCGGVNLKEVNFKTMESRCCPGLYFAGEILDIDGVTGGFNFQNAWTTGWIAGQSMGV